MPLNVPYIRTAVAAAPLVWLLALASPVVAAGQASGAIAQGFKAGQGADIVAGALVSAKADSSHSVELATADSADRLVGVVDTKPLVAISQDNSEVQVVLSGTTTVLVSDINGPIKASDKITASPIAGVGMVATADSRVVGAAQADFDVSKARTQTVTDRKGQSHTVHVGLIAIQVGVAYYQAPGSNFLPPFVQSLANSVAGRPVALLRVVLSAALLLAGFLSVAVLIYSSVRSAMISLGRNPLAASVIRKGLYQMAGIVLAVLGGTLLASYLVLML
jgi:hypothetical protein